MNQRTVSTLLIIFGAIMMLYGLFMDVSVESYDGDRIVNLHLVSQQQSILMTGGIILVCGVLLFGFRKLKQTPEQETLEREEDEKRRRAVIGTADGAKDTGKGLLESIRNLFIADINDKRNWRVGIGALTAIAVFSSPLWRILFSEESEIWEIIRLAVCIYAFVYAFRAKPLQVVFTRALVATLVVSIVSLLLHFAMFGEYAISIFGDDAVLYGLPTVIAIVLLIMVRRRFRNE